MNKLDRIRQGLSWIEAKGLNHVEWNNVSLNWSGDSVVLECYYTKNTADQNRKLKELFGPLKVTNQYDKRLGGATKLSDEMKIELVVYGAFECKTVEHPEEMTEDRWDEIRGMIREGTIKVEHCKPAQPKEEIPF